MNREEFIRYKRQKAQERYNTIFAPDYDLHWGNIEKVHKENVEHFLSLIPQGEKVLDAACGTGKYFKIVYNSKHTPIGIDQSVKMLENCSKKHPKAELNNIGLQEINYCNEFNGIMCVDALENVFPEHWTEVFNNFYNALRSKGYLYFTIELENDEEIKNAYDEARKKNMPVVYGEIALEGYHYYPSEAQVEDIIKNARLEIKLKNYSEGYLHYIVQKN